MKDAWFKEVFTEFYKLSYIREGKSKRIVLKGLSDHKVLDYVILFIISIMVLRFIFQKSGLIYFQVLILIQGLESWSVMIVM